MRVRVPRHRVRRVHDGIAPPRLVPRVGESGSKARWIDRVCSIAMDEDDGNIDETRDERHGIAHGKTALAPAMPSPLARPVHNSDPNPDTLDRVERGALLGRYVLRDELLGRGGMGEVVLAHDAQIGREVAVKRMRRAQPSQEESSRFVREARIQGRLEHPAVVPVHDLAYDGAGQPYFVMKRLIGIDMYQMLFRLRSGEDPDESASRRRLLRAFVDVCLAIEFAHSRGIVHRDLKPANIMLGDFGEVYVLDWGVARAIADSDERDDLGHDDPELEGFETQLGSVLGTPAYMAPEQRVGDRAGPAADIYALGCILYEIIAGAPFHARSESPGAKPLDACPSEQTVDDFIAGRLADADARAFAGHLARCATCSDLVSTLDETRGPYAPVAPPERSEYPPELEAISERATQLDPSDRFESARAMGVAVQAYLDGDRDAALRRELARHHIVEARDAFARGTHDDRRDAMRAAGRALAFDPEATEAADLVSRLMLEPPAETPDDVEQRLVALDRETVYEQAWPAALAVWHYVAFVPLFFWSGVRDASLILAFAAVAIVCGTYILRMRAKVTPLRLYASAAINALLIAVMGRIMGPIVVIPTLVTTTVMAYAVHPRFGRISVIAAILLASAFGPWALELLGVLSPTHRFTDAGELVLASGAVRFSAIPTELAFAFMQVSMVVGGVLLVRSVARRHSDAARKLELQAWQLRHIVPSIAG